MSRKRVTFPGSGLTPRRRGRFEEKECTEGATRRRESPTRMERRMVPHLTPAGARQIRRKVSRNGGPEGRYEDATERDRGWSAKARVARLTLCGSGALCKAEMGGQAARDGSATKRSHGNPNFLRRCWPHPTSTLTLTPLAGQQKVSQSAEPFFTHGVHHQYEAAAAGLGRSGMGKWRSVVGMGCSAQQKRARSGFSGIVDAEIVTAGPGEEGIHRRRA